MTETKPRPTREQTWEAYPNDAKDILTEAEARTTRCRQHGCQALVWWGVSAARGARCPFDVMPDGTRTGTNHWRTCTDRPQRS